MRTRKQQSRVTLGNKTSIISNKARNYAHPTSICPKGAHGKKIPSTSRRKDGLMHVVTMDLTFMHQ